jgi:hypothetical protein
LKKWLSSVKKIRYLHPLLFGVMPVITLYSTNMNQIDAGQILRSILISCVGTATFLLLLWFILKDLEWAALVTSLIAILLFNYGRAYASASFFHEQYLLPRGILLDSDQLMMVSHIVLFTLWLLVGILGVLLFKRADVWRPQITQYFALLGIVAIFFPALKIFRYHVDLSTPSDIPDTAQTHDSGMQADASLPDIYYIILDAYGREDVLQDVYQYDNSPFLNQLQSLGFHVTSESRSNYSLTWLSIASSLNMDYMEQLMEFPTTDPMCIPLVSQHLASGEVLQFLKQRRYQTYAIATRFEPTEIRGADHYIYSEWYGLNGFESLMLRNSFFNLLYDVSSMLNGPLEHPGYRTHRDHVHFILDTLAQMPDEPGPKFVFAHILSPHPPFIFGPNGETVKQRLPYSIFDGDEYPGTEEEYLKGYRDQITYINGRIQDLVRHLIEDSEMAPIIILQGDHGPKSSMEGKQISYDVFKETVAILNAYYFPDGEYGALYPSISPVNSFRIVLNHFFNHGYDVLPDLTYFTTDPCGETMELLPEEDELDAYFENREN